MDNEWQSYVKRKLQFPFLFTQQSPSYFRKLPVQPAFFLRAEYRALLLMPTTGPIHGHTLGTECVITNLTSQRSGNRGRHPSSILSWPCPSWELTRAQVGHGGGQLEVGRLWVVTLNLNGASPLVHHLVDAHLEHLSVPQGSAAQHHAMIEVVGGTEGMASGDSDPPNTLLQSSALQYPADDPLPKSSTHGPHSRRPPKPDSLPPTCPPPPPTPPHSPLRRLLPTPWAILVP